MEDNNYTPFVNRPDNNSNAYASDGRQVNKLADAAKVLGIIAVVSVFGFTLYIPMMLGGLAIIMAILSRGSEDKLPEAARTAVATGIVALTLNIAIVGGALWLMFTDNPVRDAINETCTEMYGQSMEDMIEDAADGQLDLEYNNLPEEIY